MNLRTISCGLATQGLLFYYARGIIEPKRTVITVGLIDPKVLKKAYLAKGKDKLRISTVINELEIMEKHNLVDAIHYAGGCYCRECKEWTGIVLGSRCKRFSFPPNSWICTKPDDFCSYGRRREGGE